MEQGLIQCQLNDWTHRIRLWQFHLRKQTQSSTFTTQTTTPSMRCASKHNDCYPDLASTLTHTIPTAQFTRVASSQPVKSKPHLLVYQPIIPCWWRTIEKRGEVCNLRGHTTFATIQRQLDSQENQNEHPEGTPYTATNHCRARKHVAGHTHRIV